MEEGESPMVLSMVVMKGEFPTVRSVVSVSVDVPLQFEKAEGKLGM